MGSAVNVYKRSVIEKLRNKIHIYAIVTQLKLRTHLKISFMHLKETRYFSKLEGGTRQWILCNRCQQVFWNKESKAFPKSFARLFRFFYKTASSLKSSAVVAYLVDAVSLSFSDE